METRFILAVRLFEFYAQWLWPLHRLFVGRRISRRCVKCAASERLYALGGDGHCSECLKPIARTNPTDPVAAEMKAAFARLLKQAELKGAGRYDAVVMFSGGKDSTYMVRRLQIEHPKLRLLAVTLHNGFMSPVAEANVRRLVERLDVDHLFIRPRRSFYLKLFRYTLTHINERGAYDTVDFSDGEFMLDTARMIAAEKGIPMIICGYSRFQVESGLGLKDFESPRSKELQNRLETAGIPLNHIFDEDELKAWWQGSKVPPERAARLIFPLFVWNLEENEIIDKVRKWGLLPEGMSSPALTNHQLIPLIGVTDIHQRGFSSFEPEFCRMIREGKADRRHWRRTFEFLEYTARTGFLVQPLIDQLLTQLNLTRADLGIKFTSRIQK